MPMIDVSARGRPGPTHVEPAVGNEIAGQEVLLRSQSAKDFVTFRSHIKLIPLQVYANERISISAIRGQLRSKQGLPENTKSFTSNDFCFLELPTQRDRRRGFGA